MSLNYYRHGLLCPEECCVRDYIHATDQTKVATYGERLPTVAHYITRLTAKGTLDNHVLVVDCQTVITVCSSHMMCDLFSQYSLTLLLGVVCTEHNGKGMEEKHCGEPRSPCQHHA